VTGRAAPHLSMDTIIRNADTGQAGNPGSFAAHNRTEDDLDLAMAPARTYGATEIVGYTYKADNYRADDLVEAMIRDGIAAPGARGMAIEDVLNQIAGAEAVDREDEYSFDSDDFPKVIFGSQIDIADAPWLGDEYWSFTDYENEPLTAEDALNQFIESYEPDVDTDEDDGGLWDMTDRAQTPEFNIKAIESQATYLGLDLDALGYSLPTKTAARA
jgi:hypothetical protein